MPVAGGPNTLGESNLVFAYDTGDVSNSYIGAPTTNICTGADYSIYNSGATNARNQTFPLPFKPGYEVVKVAANTPGTYGQSILWTATYSSSPTTATNSVYAWLESGTYVQVGQHWHPWNYGSPKYIEKGKWVRISETYAINEGGSYSAAGMVYSTDGVAYFCMPQYELKPYMTPFINFSGTRSATQGLLPVVGTSSIDLTNVSFNSNAQMVFDGTNDYVDCGAIQPFDLSARNVTWEAVVKFNNTSGAEAIMTRWNNSTGEVWWFGRYDTTKIHVAFIIGGDGSGHYSDGNIGTSAGYYHVAVTLNDTVLSFYINGVLDSTDTVAAGTWTSDPDPNLLIGAQNQGAASNLNGEIPVAKIYNRALTAQEVKQNYQQYKTRFNLS